MWPGVAAGCRPARTVDDCLHELMMTFLTYSLKVPAHHCHHLFLLLCPPPSGSLYPSPSCYLWPLRRRNGSFVCKLPEQRRSFLSGCSPLRHSAPALSFIFFEDVSQRQSASVRRRHAARSAAFRGFFTETCLEGKKRGISEGVSELNEKRAKALKSEYTTGHDHFHRSMRLFRF